MSVQVVQPTYVIKTVTGVPRSAGDVSNAGTKIVHTGVPNTSTYPYR